MLNDEQQVVFDAYIREHVVDPGTVTIMPWPLLADTVEVFALGELPDGFYRVNGSIVERQPRGSTGWEAVYEYGSDS